MKKILLIAAVALAASAYQAKAGHVSFGISVGLPVAVCAPVAPAPVYVAPAPVVYAPAPVYVAPAPVVYAPAPVAYVPAPVAYPCVGASFVIGGGYHHGWSGGGWHGGPPHHGGFHPYGPRH